MSTTYLLPSGGSVIGGTSQADVLIGGGFGDSIVGGDGADSLDGGLGFDTLLGQGGNDTIQGGLDSDLISGGDGNDLLLGGPSADTQSLIPIGNASLSSQQAKLGGSSSFFDGNGDILRIQVGDIRPVGEFTWEAWIRPTDVEGENRVVIYFGSAGGTAADWFPNGSGFIGIIGGKLKLAFDGEQASQVLEHQTPMQPNVWTHIALTRDNQGVNWLWLDGVKSNNSYKRTAQYAANSNLSVGNRYNGDLIYDFAGWIDEVRISNVARYSTNFTPSSTEFVRDNNTQLLLHFNGTADQFYGGAGSDTMVGSARNSFFDGGEGIDVVKYSDLSAQSNGTRNFQLLFLGGDFIVQTTNGADTLRGVEQIVIKVNNADSVIHVYEDAAGASDTVNLSSGDDVYDVKRSNVVVLGGSGNDSISVNNLSAVSVDGGWGNDTLTTNLSTTSTQAVSLGHRLSGGPGQDYIAGSLGDSIDAGDGDDTIIFVDGIQQINGGTGSDRLLISSTVTAFGFEKSLIESIESIEASATGSTVRAGTYAIQLIAAPGGSTLVGSGQADTLIGRGSNDLFVADPSDCVVGGGGIDTVQYATDVLSSELTDAKLSGISFVQVAASNVLRFDFSGQSEALSIIDDDSAHSMIGGSGPDAIRGRGGNDTIIGSTGDSIDAGADDDVVFYVTGVASAEGGSGIDKLVLNSTITTFDLSASPVSGFEIIDARDVSGASSIRGNEFGQSILAGNGGGYRGGQQGDDYILGGTQAQTIDGGIGDDTLIGGPDADLLSGGDGDDVLIPGGISEQPLSSTNTSQSQTGQQGGTALTTSAGETLDGGAGRDTAFVDQGAGAEPQYLDSEIQRVEEIVIRATTPNGLYYLKNQTEDLLIRSMGRSAQIHAGHGADTIIGSVEGDTIWGGYGPGNVIYGEAGDDEILGAFSVASAAVVGADQLYGGAGNDTISGFDGPDYLDGGDGADSLLGGAGRDTLIGGAGNDLLDGGADIDVVSYSAATSPIIVDLLKGTARPAGSPVADIGSDSLIGIEAVVAGPFGDSVMGSAEDNYIVGGAGNDTMRGGEGSDTLGYLGNRSAYTVSIISPSDSVYQISSTAEGSDVVSGFEWVQFADTLMAVQSLIQNAETIKFYSLQANADSVDEGQTASFTLTTTNVASGTKVPYSLTGTGITAADVLGGALSGTATVGANGTATISVGLLADRKTEGNETLTISSQGSSASVTVKDTSLTPQPVYRLTAAAASVNEGSNAVFNLVTENVDPGTVLGFTVEASGGFDASDVVKGRMSGSVAVGSDGRATIRVPIRNDDTTELNAEAITVKVQNQSASMTINDTSKEPVRLSTPPAVVGGTMTFTNASETGKTIFTGTVGAGSTPVAISSGIVEVGAGGSLGSAPVSLGANATLAFGRSDDVAVANPISGAGGFKQSGTGKVVLSSTNTYTGPTTVAAGTLVITGALSGTGQVAVEEGATLGGTGTVAGPVAIGAGGGLAPGASPGAFVMNNGLTIAAGGTLYAEINGTVAGTDYDQLIVSGTVDITDAVLSVSVGFASRPWNSYTIITNDGSDAVVGTFANLAEGAVFAAGSRFMQISYQGGTGNDVTLTDVPYCLVQGTRVMTPQGEVAVEALSRGDRIVTLQADGRVGESEVRWLGVQRLRAKAWMDPRLMPVCIKAGALGEGLPTRDLYVSPDHGLLVDGHLIHAKALINGQSIVQVQRWVGDVVYWHVETQRHDVMFAEGVPNETLIDAVSRKRFDNYAEYEALYPVEPMIQTLRLPRVQFARQLPQPIANRLKVRAAAIGSTKYEKDWVNTD